MSDEKVWHKQPGETNTEYFFFSRYFLTLGPTRTLLKAWRAYCAIEQGKEIGDTAHVSIEWNEMCEKHNWRERADAFDADIFTENGAVEAARVKLKTTALDAAIALENALTSSRQSVQAANSILDRVGIVATQGHVIGKVPFTADEMAEAAKEIEEWEQRAKSG